MRIRRVVVLLLGLLVCALPVPAAAQQKSLTLGTASVGGTYFIYGGVVASLLSEKLGANVSTQQTQGPNQNIILVQNKNIELGMTTMGIALQAWNGAPWTQGKKFQDIRAVFPMYDTPFHFITTDRSGVKAVADLNGKVVGVGPRAGTPGTYFPLMFDALGIKTTIRNGSASDMVGQLGDGLMQAFAFAAGLPIASFSEIEAQRPVVFFTFTDQQRETLKKKYPELSDAVIPKGTYKTLTEDHKTVGVYNFFIVHKDQPDDLVYRITKTVLENNEALVKGHSSAKETVIQNWNKNGFLPFHPGAVRYYKEKGITIPASLQAK
jgi:TRAP transporter TAXI family solute receptor